MSEIPDFVLTILDEIAKTEGFTEVDKVFQAGSNHGDNFVGIMTSVTLKGIRNGLAGAELHLLCKLEPENVHRREAFKTSFAFSREVYAYNHILPKFLEFQRKKGLTESQWFTAYPKCYAAISDEENGHSVVILEDLRPRGYVMWPKNKAIDLKHSQKVMEQLGRFHAISFAMKDQQPDLFEEFKQMHDLTAEFFKSGALLMAFEKSFEKAVGVVTNEDHAKKLLELTKKPREVFRECLDGKATQFDVVGHGDCWNNNILYKYDEKVKITFFFCNILVIDNILCS